MEGTVDDSGKPAPYGRACVNCARAKRKCMLQNSGGCERCFRLKEECNPPPTVRKRRPGPGRSQAARLEQKLDGIVSLIKAQNGSAELNEPSPAARRGSRRDDRISRRHPPSTANSPSEASDISRYNFPEGVEPSLHEAEEYFQNFCSQYLRFLPIVHIEKRMTSQRLRRESPFFWTCIMAVTSTNLTQQIALGRSIREIAANEVIVEGKRTVDLVLGLLCIIAWGHFRFSMGPLLNIFSHLCTALTLDLEYRTQRPASNDINKVFPPPIEAQIEKDPPPRSMEHRRIALACYFLTSCVATLQLKAESLAWSPYLEQCMHVIDDAEDNPGDKVLVYMVKLQRITSKAVSVSIQMTCPESEQSTRLISPYISSLNAELAGVRSSIAPYSAANKVLHTMLNHTEICINDLILLRVRHAPLSTDPGTSSMEALFACLSAAKSSVDIMLNLNPEEYACFPFFVWKQFRVVILSLIRLASLEDPAWDVNLVRRTVDLPFMLEHTIQALSTLQNTGGSNVNRQENVFSKSLAWVNTVRSWWVSVFGQLSGSRTLSGQEDPGVVLGGGVLLSEEPIPDMVESARVSGLDSFFLLDDDLFGDHILRSWECL